MGTAKYRVAVPDFAAANPSSQPLGKQFSDIVRADLDFSGIIDLVSPSMYPLQVPSQPSEFQAQAWADAPASSQFLGFGNINASGNTLAVQAWLNDVKNTSAPPMIAKIYRGEVTDAQLPPFRASRFADEIIMKLSGGLPGISTTQIAFVSTRAGGNKEIWAMDYDGSNQHELNQPSHSIALTPHAGLRTHHASHSLAHTSPDARVSPALQICIYSVPAAKN